MKQLIIHRTSPTQANVVAVQIDGTEKPVLENVLYQNAMSYVADHQTDLVIYKIGKTFVRKNGKRHYMTSIYAKDNKEAIDYFHAAYDLQVQTSLIYYYLELCTGDWKVIDTIIKE